MNLKLYQCLFFFISGEQPAAMQTSKGIGITPNAHFAVVTFCIFSIAAWHYSTISQVSNLISVYKVLQHKHLPHKKYKILQSFQQHLPNYHKFYIKLCWYNQKQIQLLISTRQENFHRSHRIR